MRVSKPPEVRRQEIIDTAMRLFAAKGYEFTTITDIAKEMHVVSGLCYRYFRSKEELYHAALDQYAAECAAPYIRLMNLKLTSFEEYKEQYVRVFIKNDGHEKYHDFFHKDENEMFHKQLELSMVEKLQPTMVALLEHMQRSGIIHTKDCKNSALLLLYGQIPIINNDSLTSEDKIRIISEFYCKVLEIK